ncbi:hypothetical protein TCAL_01214 [Tigriopus californicus]|uniref:Kringle domain-containing protein n=1 Tax=Tigriopus californicus TaxID=6832 RepID=A0A553NZJ5_TIGCA|nr:uncharacterized protein LOC131887236 [Tigriopus californicus]TRY70847.1 hypothetical protein TCAL_01214 [Tigriopus californicus]
MITNLERRETKPGDVGALDFGLMGSITRIEAPGLNLEIIAAFGTNFQEAFQNWGNYLRGYHGKVIDQDKNDLVNDYLGYWTDNGAFYYYRTLEGKNYEETLIELTDFFKQSGASIPVRHLEIDSWWYPKDFLLAVEEWSALEDIFPNGLDFLQNRIGLPIVAHNRYWSRNTTYAKENGGAFDFIREIVAIPQDQDFWNYFFQEARKWGLKVYNQDWQDYQIALMNATVTDLRVSRNWLNQMALGAELNDIQIQYCMTLPKEAMASVETNSVTRIRVSEDYLLAEDQWRIGITSLFAHALGLKPFKDVFWTSSRNGGNNYYYDCMEVALDADPNVPWPLNYRYVGQASVTKSGHSCIPWSTLNLHYAYPLGDLVRNYCRNPVGLLAGNGRPFCFYEADLSKPMSEWKWENCDVTICDEDCTRDQSMVNATFPYCPELVEPNPELQAAVSTLSLGGVGFGDRMDAIDESVLAKTCREDGKILTVDEPALAAPVQLLEMAFSGLHLPENPTSSEIGEIWSSFVSLDGLIYGVVFGAENSISRPVTPWQLGLNLTPGVQYVVARHYNSESLILLDDSQELSLELMEEHEFELLYFVPMMEIEGFQIGLLGERQKFVPFSKDRFIGVGLSNQFLTLKSTGTTEVTLILKSQGELSSKTINCAESDSSAHVTYTYDLNTEESFCSFN